ncbi:hypothetical protein THAOC_11694, partial [Thalassiosira oceanica]
MTAMKRPIRSCGGGSDPGPLSSPPGPEAASARVSFEVGKARLSGGRRRPPVARHEGRGNADTIPWRRLQSGPVIIPNETKRCLGEACFVRMVGSGREPPTQKKKGPLAKIVDTDLPAAAELLTSLSDMDGILWPTMGHGSEIEGLIARIIAQLAQSDHDFSWMRETLQDERDRITESLRPLNKTFNGLHLGSPEYK